MFVFLVLKLVIQLKAPCFGVETANGKSNALSIRKTHFANIHSKQCAVSLVLLGKSSNYAYVQ